MSVWDTVSFCAEVAKLEDAPEGEFWQYDEVNVGSTKGKKYWIKRMKLSVLPGFSGRSADPREGKWGEEWQQANQDVSARQNLMRARYK